MTLNEWVKNELEYWSNEIKDSDGRTMEAYCKARIDAAAVALKFIEINERDEMKRTEWINKEIRGAENRMDALLREPLEKSISFETGFQCGVKSILQKLEQAYRMNDINDFQAILEEVKNETI